MLRRVYATKTGYRGCWGIRGNCSFCDVTVRARCASPNEDNLVDPVTTYTDNSTIGSEYLPITYDIWFVDSVTLTRTDVCTRCLTTSSTFSDASMISGRTYLFYGKAYLNDGTPSDNSTGYDWVAYFLTTNRAGSMSGGWR